MCIDCTLFRDTIVILVLFSAYPAVLGFNKTTLSCQRARLEARPSLRSQTTDLYVAAASAEPGSSS
jgi:hypothetical protein